MAGSRHSRAAEDPFAGPDPGDAPPGPPGAGAVTAAAAGGSAGQVGGRAADDADLVDTSDAVDDDPRSAPPSLAAHLAARRGTERAYTAFVVGATGYVGRALIAELRRAGHGVVAHVRPGSPREAALATFAAQGAEVDRTPLASPALGARLAALAPTHIFLCHGTTKASAKREGLVDPYEAVDVGVTRAVVDAARGLAGADAPRLVHLSSMGAGGRGAYLAARGRAEALVRASGLPFTLCRAPIVTGPDRDEDRPLERIGAAAFRVALAALGKLGLRRLAGRYSPMDARETAEGLVRSGFHHMTIDRVVLADELRRVGVYERERWHPRSARDEGRH